MSQLPHLPLSALPLSPSLAVAGSGSARKTIHLIITFPIPVVSCVQNEIDQSICELGSLRCSCSRRLPHCWSSPSPAPCGKCTIGQGWRGLSGLGYASVRRTKDEQKTKKRAGKEKRESDAPNATTDNNELQNKRGRDTQQQWAMGVVQRAR